MRKYVQLPLCLFAVVLFSVTTASEAQAQDRTCFSYKAKPKSEKAFADAFNERIEDNKLPCEEVTFGQGDDPEDPKDAPRDKVVYSCGVSITSTKEAIDAVFAAVGESFEIASKYDPNARAVLSTMTCKAGCVPWSCYGQPAVCWKIGKKCIQGCQ